MIILVQARKQENTFIANHSDVDPTKQDLLFNNHSEENPIHYSNLRYFPNLYSSNPILSSSSLTSPSTTTAVAKYNIPSYQIQALQDLYESTKGWQWDWKLPLSRYGSKWNFTQSDPNPCNEGWQGITCSSDCSFVPCSMTELILDGYGLDGTLPMSIGNLTSLTTLEIYSNPLFKGR
jgi:hypothetical protein